MSNEEAMAANENSAREYALRILARQVQAKDAAAFQRAAGDLPAEAQEVLRRGGIIK